MTKPLFLVQGFSHMGNHSGYELLFTHLAESIPSQTITVKEMGARHRLHKLIKQKMGIKYGDKRNPFYNPTSLSVEKQALRIATKGKANLIHYGYFENQYEALSRSDRISKLKKAGVPVVATIHQPFSWWVYKGQLDLMESLDGIVVLSEFEQERLSELYGKQVRFIPHGVDTEFFRPDSEKKDSNAVHCLFAGQWLRDFNVLREVIASVSQKNKDIVFDLLLPSNKGDYEILAPVLRNTSVRIHRGLSDDQLRALYQQADMLFQPLIDCTANNAVLESMASGLPIICTDVPGIHSYIDESFCHLVKNGASEATATILDWADNGRDVLRVKGQAARRYAEEHLAWPIVAESMVDYYKELNPGIKG